MYKLLTSEQRYTISVLLEQDLPKKEIATAINVHNFLCILCDLLMADMFKCFCFWHVLPNQSVSIFYGPFLP